MVLYCQITKIYLVYPKVCVNGCVFLRYDHRTSLDSEQWIPDEERV